MQWHRAQGFTLLEILIAMAIFSLIGLASTGLLNRVIDSDEISTERFARLQHLQRAMLTIERDLLQAVPRPVRIAGEKNERVLAAGQNMFDSEADGIGLVRSGFQNPQLMLRRSTMQAVAYRLQDQQLQRLYGNYVDNVIGYEPKIRILLGNVSDFRVEFYLDRSRDPNDEDSWESSYQGTALPVGVAVTLESEEFGIIRRQFNMASGAS